MKEKILNALENNRGKFVSGEQLAEDFKVTRAAVWKAIQSLRKEGHKIKAITNKGYRLERFSDVLTKEGITANLKSGTKISEVLCFDTINSTNTYAKNLALSGAKRGTLIAANHQTQGRGRSGHSFESPAGTGLYMTLILRPEIEMSKFQMITIADAVAVCKAIEDLSGGIIEGLKIKWVNDVFLRGKKITGILTEAITNFENGEIESVITGIGINVSTKKFQGNLSETAGAIFEHDEILFGRDELCARVADYIMDMAENLNDPEMIKSYRERSMLTGKNITYMKNNESHSAKVEGIDDLGGLEIINDKGEREILRSGEVFMVREHEK